jgi:hypothetical protein
MLVVAAGMGVQTFLLMPPREDMEAGIRVEGRNIEG